MDLITLKEIINKLPETLNNKEVLINTNNFTIGETSYVNIKDIQVDDNWSDSTIRIKTETPIIKDLQEEAKELIKIDRMMTNYIYCCPNCHGVIKNTKYKYCPHCGQMVTLNE